MNGGRGVRWFGVHPLLRLLLSRPALTVHRDEAGYEVYDVRPDLFGPAILTSSRAEAMRLLHHRPLL